MGIFNKLRRNKTGGKKATKTTRKAPARQTPTKELQPQCAALTASGKQCANSARSGSKYCGSHKGYQPPARGKARGTNTKPGVKRAHDTAASGRRKAGTKQCAAKTKAGKRCQRDAVTRGKYCSIHKTT